MIIGIGIDIVDVKRIEQWKNTPGLINRYFHPLEIEESKSKGVNKYLSLSAKFAAKEAYGKALGIGLRGISLKDIQTTSNKNGKPSIIVHKSAKNALVKSGAEKIFVSLSHERDKAIAIVVLEA